MKKRNLIIASVIIAVFVLVLALSVAACSPRQSVTDETVATLGTEPAETEVLETEPPETELHETEPTIEATEMPETEPQETESQPTQPAANPATTTFGSNQASAWPGSTTTTPMPAESEPTTPPTSAPAPTEPIPTAPPVSEPPTTEAPTAEPEPVGCSHSWQEVYHEEVSHKVWWVVCTCGARFTTTAEWGTHVDSFSLSDAFTYHGGNGAVSETVIDSPAYSTWVCSKCGAVSDTQP